MMILPDKKDAIHKAWLFRILEAIADDAYLAQVLFFKGGTCAAMLDWLDRFSVDLDFDYAGKIEDIPKTRAALEKIFADQGLTIKDFSKNGIQYFVRYENSGRNTLKIEASFPIYKSSTYAPQRLVEIDRVLNCQTKETMFAHKLVVLIDRFEKTGHIAGRDVYDIHYFFLHGYEYNVDVIRERRGVESSKFFGDLLNFIEKEVMDKFITEDLSTLLSYDRFFRIRKVLKRELVGFLKDEIARINN